MKQYAKEIIFGMMLVPLLARLIFWFVTQEPTAFLQIGIAAAIVFVGIAAFIWKVSAKYRNLKTGAPSDDEFTEIAKLHAGSQAFLISMYLWLLIFIFHTSFTNQEEMLGVGILGSALIYGICLWYYKTTAEFNEK